MTLRAEFKSIPVHDCLPAVFEMVPSFSHASSRLQVEVYTFGCPRVGNASFSTAYDKLVPETWHIINDRDTVGSAHSNLPCCLLVNAAHLHVLRLTDMRR
jgi:predicted lipase